MVREPRQPIMTLSVDTVLAVTLCVSSWASFFALRACGVPSPWAAILCLPSILALTILAFVTLMTLSWLAHKRSPGDDA